MNRVKFFTHSTPSLVHGAVTHLQVGQQWRPPLQQQDHGRSLRLQQSGVKGHPPGLVVHQHLREADKQRPQKGAGDVIRRHRLRFKNVINEVRETAPEVSHRSLRETAEVLLRRNEPGRDESISFLLLILTCRKTRPTTEPAFTDQHVQVR